MKQLSVRLALFAAVTTLSAGVVAQDDPLLYEGKSVSHWLATLRSDDESRDARAKAAWILGYARRGSAGVPAALFRALEGDDATIARQAQESLFRLRAAAVPVLVGALKSDTGSDALKRTIDRTLNVIGEPSVSHLVEALADAPTQRNRILSILGSMGAQAHDAVPAIVTGLQESSRSGERSRLIRCLDEIGPGARAAIPALIELIDNPELGVAAAVAIRRTGEKVDVAFEALLRRLKTGSDRDKINAAIALGRDFGPDAAEAVPALLPLLERKDARFVVRALAEIGKPVAIAVAKTALEKETFAERNAALGALLQMGYAAKPAVPVLTLIIGRQKAENAELVKAARVLRGLGIHARSALPTLSTMFANEDADPDLRFAAALGLAFVGYNKGLPALEFLEATAREKLEDSPKLRALIHAAGVRKPIGIQKTVLRALGKLGPPATEAIVDLRKDGRLRFDANRTLREMFPGPDPALVLPVFIEELASPDRDIRRSAIQLLATMGRDAQPAVPALEKLKETESAHDDITEALEVIAVDASWASDSNRRDSKDEDAAKSQHRELLSQSRFVRKLPIAKGEALAYLEAHLKTDPFSLLLDVVTSDRSPRASRVRSLLNTLFRRGELQERFVQALKDDDVRVRRAVAFAASGSRRQSFLSTHRLPPGFARQLEVALNDSDANVRRLAVRALTSDPEWVRGSIPTLERLVEAKDAFVRHESTEALKRMGIAVRPEVETTDKFVHHYTTAAAAQPILDADVEASGAFLDGADGLFFVIDRSGSAQAGGRVAIAKRWAVRAINGLPPDAEFAIVFADTGTHEHPEKRRAAKASEEAKAAAIEFVQSAPRGRGSCPQEGFLAALAFAQSSTASRKLLIYLGDGGLSCVGAYPPSAYAEQIIETVTGINRAQVEIHAIGIDMDPWDEPFLRYLAETNGGGYVRLAKADR